MLSPYRPKMPLTYVVDVYSDMSLSKGHLGSRGGGGGGETSPSKLKETSYIFPYDTPIVYFLALLLFFKTRNAFTQSLV